MFVKPILIKRLSLLDFSCSEAQFCMKETDYKGDLKLLYFSLINLIARKMYFFCEKNNVFLRKRKHIDTRYHFICELVYDGQIYLQLCGSKE